MSIIFLVFIGLAVITGCGVLQWEKDLEKNIILKDWLKVRQSFISLAVAIVLGASLFFVMNIILFHEFGITQSYAFMPFWIFLMLAGVQLFYEWIIQKGTKIIDTFVDKKLMN